MYREDNILYLVMQLLPGQNLRDVWDRLSETERTSICNQLRSFFAEIRSIPSPGIFGSVAGGPVPHRFFGWMDQESHIFGPFKSSLDFIVVWRSISRSSMDSMIDGHGVPSGSNGTLCGPHLISEVFLHIAT